MGAFAIAAETKAQGSRYEEARSPVKVRTNMVMAMRGTPETIMNRALEALEGFSDILSAPPLLWTRRPFSKNKNTIPILSSL